MGYLRLKAFEVSKHDHAASEETDSSPLRIMSQMVILIDGGVKGLRERELHPLSPTRRLNHFLGLLRLKRDQCVYYIHSSSDWLSRQYTAHAQDLIQC